MRQKKPVILVGAGAMAIEYAKVLRALQIPFIPVTRSEKSGKVFQETLGIQPETGGLAAWVKKTTAIPDQAIIAVTEDQLGIVARQLIAAGCKSILLEKPGGLDNKDIKQVGYAAQKRKTKVFIGYNRRFYASVLKAKEYIKKNKVMSFNFDFTERSYVIEKLTQSPAIKKEWFIQNSSHVIDLAFFLGGWPEKITCFKKGSLPWHPHGSLYAGAGISNKKAVFSYHANWGSPGKWSIELMTKSEKLIFKPLEKLQIQKYGSMNIEEVPLDDTLDTDFKPGLYRQVKAFLNTPSQLLTISEQVKKLTYYNKIHGGN